MELYVLKILKNHIKTCWDSYSPDIWSAECEVDLLNALEQIEMAINDIKRSMITGECP